MGIFDDIKLDDLGGAVAFGTESVLQTEATSRAMEDVANVFDEVETDVGRQMAAALRSGDPRQAGAMMKLLGKDLGSILTDQQKIVGARATAAAKLGTPVQQFNKMVTANFGKPGDFDQRGERFIEGARQRFIENAPTVGVAAAMDQAQSEISTAGLAKEIAGSGDFTIPGVGDEPDRHMRMSNEEAHRRELRGAPAQTQELIDQPPGFDLPDSDVSRLNQTVINSRGVATMANQLSDIVAKQPGIFGFVGGVRSAAQNMMQSLVDAGQADTAQFLMGLVAEAEGDINALHRENKIGDDERDSLLGTFDPSIDAGRFIERLLRYKSAKLAAGGNRTAVETARMLSVTSGFLPNSGSTLSQLGALVNAARGEHDLAQRALIEGQRGIAGGPFPDVSPLLREFGASGKKRTPEQGSVPFPGQTEGQVAGAPEPPPGLPPLSTPAVTSPDLPQSDATVDAARQIEFSSRVEALMNEGMSQAQAFEVVIVQMREDLKKAPVIELEGTAAPAPDALQTTPISLPRRGEMGVGAEAQPLFDPRRGQVNRRGR